MDFKIAAYTDVGIKKSTNQDSVLIKAARTDEGNVLLAAVCDGMGGLEKGELASATLVRIFSRWFEEQFPQMLYQGMCMENLQENWTSLIYQANAKILNYSRTIHAAMGTTMVVLLIIGQRYYIGNVGDSRIYQLRDALIQLTKDHTLIQKEVEEGRIAEEEARRDPRRNVLLQCVGASERIEPDFYTGIVAPGTMFLLCSDGFRHVISPEEIYQYLTPYKIFTEQAMKEGLVYLTDLNKYRQEADNISAVLVRAD